MTDLPAQVPDVDEIALERLVPYLREAVAAQPAHVRDQLDAALAAGRSTLRFEPSAVGVVVVVSVDGHEVAEVDLRSLLGDVQ